MGVAPPAGPRPRRADPGHPLDGGGSPHAAQQKLPAAVIADFETWVGTGPSVSAPEGAARRRASLGLPASEGLAAPGNGRHPIDAFIRDALAAKGLSPSPPADPADAAPPRDLRPDGPPADAGEMDAFARRSVGRRPTRGLVDRLLASPRYGERWGRHWLDVARYADTKGYVFDARAPTSRLLITYRDWVIRAFNEDLPYDRFLSRADRGRPLLPAEDGRRSLGRAGLPHPGPPVPRQHPRHHRRPHRRRRSRGLLGLTRRLRPLPRPQVRSDPDGRLLLALRRVCRIEEPKEMPLRWRDPRPRRRTRRELRAPEVTS